MGTFERWNVRTFERDQVVDSDGDAGHGQRSIDLVVCAEGQQMNGILRRSCIDNELKKDAIIEVNSTGPGPCQVTLELMAMQRWMKWIVRQLTQRLLYRLA